MTTRQSWVFEGLLVLCSMSLVGAKGCVFDGDSSLGSDAGSGENGGTSNEAGGSSSDAGTAASSAGKSTSGGKPEAGAAAVAGASGGGSSGSGGMPSSAGGAEPGAGGEPSAAGAGGAGDLTCPSYLQTDTVYFVQPLNRPERACLVLDEPLHVSCSMLLDPSLTVPTGWPTTRCATRNGTSFYAGTTLPKAEGWADCSPQEAEIVDQAPDCAML